MVQAHKCDDGKVCQLPGRSLYAQVANGATQVCMVVYQSAIYFLCFLLPEKFCCFQIDSQSNLKNHIYF